MKKYVSYCLAAGALAASALAIASPASAQAVACGYYQPGLLAALSLAPVRPAPCYYQGPYIVNQGPMYDGPAIVAPQATYQPSRTINYVYDDYQGPEPVMRAPAVRHRAVRHSVRKKSSVQGKGKPQVVRANAEVRIYGPQRMDIRLYRR